MNIVRSRKIFYLISGMFVAASLASLALRGINFGADFTGDARLEIEFREARPAKDAVVKAVADAGGRAAILTEAGERGYIIRTNYLTEEEHTRIVDAIGGLGEFSERGFTSIGPSVGRQLRRNALFAIAIALLAIVFFIAFAFRHVSKPVSSWIYGIVAIIALAHDISIPTGLFSFLQIEIDSLFVSALLTVLGFSIHDTIVVFDRVRENLRKSGGAPPAGGKFEEIVGRSLKETITRSINTSMTTVLALAAIYFFGGATTKDFALALIIGIVVGTYSSICIASPLLVTYNAWREKYAKSK